MPIQRRLPKRGFHNPGRIEYQVVNVGRLTAAPAGVTVDRAWLESQRIVRRPGPIKLLGSGAIKAAITVRVDAASEQARKAIETAGGKLEVRVARREAQAPSPRSPKPRPAAEPDAPTPKAPPAEADR